METKYPPDDVATKVLRRAQVSKMTRALQDRLALANVKIQNGWENMSLDLIEPKVEEQLRRKRPASSNDTVSDAASTTSSSRLSRSGLGSSPLTAPLFSDEPQCLGSSHSTKRTRSADIRAATSSGGMLSRRDRMALQRQSSWKRADTRPQSSPIRPQKHARFPSNQISQLSFVSETPTVPDSPPSPDESEDDDADIPVTSFSLSASTRIISSPPHTPPPQRQERKIENVSWSRTPRTGEEGADLLLYLATSPSAGNTAQAKTVIQPPSTPPCKATPLPSSHMTPGTSGMGFIGFGPNTPGTNFNFADFVHVTPSPAQAQWARTPVAARTPAAAKEARRKLNFDGLMPPTTSPVMNRGGRGEGLGMDLGGELVS